MRQQNQGFSLIEMLIVIVILGTLSAIAIPAYFKQAREAEYTRAITVARSIATAVSAYSSEHGFPPDRDNNQEPLGADGTWVDRSEMPFESPLDYDHHRLGDGSCLVTITFFGMNQIRDSLPYQTEAEGDDRVLVVSVYACEGAAGSVR